MFQWFCIYTSSTDLQYVLLTKLYPTFAARSKKCYKPTTNSIWEINYYHFSIVICSYWIQLHHHPVLCIAVVNFWTLTIRPSAAIESLPSNWGFILHSIFLTWLLQEMALWNYIIWWHRQARGPPYPSTSPRKHHPETVAHIKLNSKCIFF